MAPRPKHTCRRPCKLGCAKPVFYSGLCSACYFRAYREAMSQADRELSRLVDRERYAAKRAATQLAK